MQAAWTRRGRSVPSHQRLFARSTLTRWIAELQAEPPLVLRAASPLDGTDDQPPRDARRSRPERFHQSRGAAAVVRFSRVSTEFTLLIGSPLGVGGRLVVLRPARATVSHSSRVDAQCSKRRPPTKESFGRSGPKSRTRSGCSVFGEPMPSSIPEPALASSSRRLPKAMRTSWNLFSAPCSVQAAERRLRSVCAAPKGRAEVRQRLHQAIPFACRCIAGQARSAGLID